MHDQRHSQVPRLTAALAMQLVDLHSAAGVAECYATEHELESILAGGSGHAGCQALARRMDESPERVFTGLRLLRGLSIPELDGLPQDMPCDNPELPAWLVAAVAVHRHRPEFELLLRPLVRLVVQRCAGGDGLSMLRRGEEHYGLVLRIYARYREQMVTLRGEAPETDEEKVEVEAAVAKFRKHLRRQLSAVAMEHESFLGLRLASMFETTRLDELALSLPEQERAAAIAHVRGLHAAEASVDRIQRALHKILDNAKKARVDAGVDDEPEDGPVGAETSPTDDEPRPARERSEQRDTAEALQVLLARQLEVAQALADSAELGLDVVLVPRGTRLVLSMLDGLVSPLDRATQSSSVRADTLAREAGILAEPSVPEPSAYPPPCGKPSPECVAHGPCPGWSSWRVPTEICRWIFRLRLRIEALVPWLVPQLQARIWPGLPAVG